MTQRFTNSKHFNLAAPLLAGASTITPPSYSGWPNVGQFPLITQDNGEFLLVTDASVHPWPILRGQEDGAPASDHAAGTVIVQWPTAASFDSLFTLAGSVVPQYAVQVYISGGTLVDGVPRSLQSDNTGGDVASISFNNGCTLDADGYHWHVPAAGRYLLIGTVGVDRHATLWTSLFVSSDVTLDVANLPIPPLSVLSVGFDPGVSYVSVVDLAANDPVNFLVRIDGANTVIGSSLWTLLYVGNQIGDGQQNAADYNVLGIGDAVAGTRLVGAKATGPPTSGDFLVGDQSNAQDGVVWICTVAGNPGTWVQASGNPIFGTDVSTTTIKATGATGATSGAQFVGGLASGHPTTGAHAVRDFVVDTDGSLWVCTATGTPGTWVQSGEPVSAQSGNKVVASPADGSSGLPAPRVLVVADLPVVDAARIRRATNQTIADATTTAISFSHVRYDTNSLADISGNPTRLTVATDGLYLMTACVEWTGYVAGANLTLSLKRDGLQFIVSDLRHTDAADPGAATQNVSTVYQFTAGQYVEVYVRQDGGAPAGIVAAVESTPEFTMTRIG